MKKIVIASGMALMLLAAGCGNNVEDTSAQNPIQTEETVVVEENTVQAVVGIVTDATMNTVTIETEDKQEITFNLNDDTVTDYQDGLLIGITVEVTFEGELDAEDTSQVIVTNVTEIPGEKAADSQDADDVVMAKQIQEAVADKDLEALAELCTYPLYVDIENGMEVEDKDAFLALGEDAVFTDRLLEVIAGVDPEALQEVEAGYVMTDDEGVTNITFKADETGKLGIVGINY